ncbi:hypothetical protein F5887DRAFT_1226968 [Amanita rubescens]|nr:hypothetical protein F5887DRAFT_1226968 [Amanita rubescens]
MSMEYANILIGFLLSATARSRPGPRPHYLLFPPHSAIDKTVTMENQRPPQSFLILRCKGFTPVAVGQNTPLDEIEMVARKSFSIPLENRDHDSIRYYTKVDDEFIQIIPAAWPDVRQAIKALWIQFRIEGQLHGP